MTSESAASFALSLLKENEKAESVVFSPFSLGAALSILHSGAGGSTRQQMTDVLLKGSEHEEVTKHYKELIEALAASNGKDITVEVASKFFLRDGITLKAAFQEDVRQTFAADAENHDFDDANGAAKAVNGFCDEKTHGKISEIVTPDVFQDAMAVLVNAVYFKGLWENPFDKDCSLEDDFNAVGGDRKEMFMWGREKNVFLNFSNDDVQVIAVPYKDPTYKMWFFLPKEGLALTEWLSSVDAAAFVQLMKDANRGKCNVKLPRFKIESSIPAKEQLEALGMRDVFEDCADLSAVSEVPLKVSDVIHKAVIEVSEEGTEAAAATGVVCVMKRAVLFEAEFFATRPFAYAITRAENVLFLGTFH